MHIYEHQTILFFFNVYYLIFIYLFICLFFLSFAGWHQTVFFYFINFFYFFPSPIFNDHLALISGRLRFDIGNDVFMVVLVWFSPNHPSANYRKTRLVLHSDCATEHFSVAKLTWLKKKTSGQPMIIDCKSQWSSAWSLPEGTDTHISLLLLHINSLYYIRLFVCCLWSDV